MRGVGKLWPDFFGPAIKNRPISYKTETIENMGYKGGGNSEQEHANLSPVGGIPPLEAPQRPLSG